MSDMDGTMSAMSDIAAAPKRTRGRTRAESGNWRRGKDDPTAVIKLELDLSGDPRTRARLESMQEAAFRLRRALQHDAANRCAAYWRHSDSRKDDPKAVRERLGLTRKGLETAAKRHIEDSGWLRDHLTKALGQHIADEVWNTVDRHLFPDASGKRHGPPRIGDWHGFTRISGRARSHTKTVPTWETFRLAGSLDGHLGAYRHPELAGEINTAADAAALPPGTSVLAQSNPMPAPQPPVRNRKVDWRGHDGPLAVVFTGLPAGDLILPVRLPQGAGQQLHLAHFLAGPDQWHKIDLVRVQDRHAPGGWRYYAHLMILGPGYVSESTRQRRAAVPVSRTAGLDGNVSKLAVVSMPARMGQGGDAALDYVTVTPAQRATAERAAKKARKRQKALDRSRRRSNPDQYEPGNRQAERAARRVAAGLAPKQVDAPNGARVAGLGGKPKRAYRKDSLSASYRRGRADHAADSRGASQAKGARAKYLAGRIVSLHGANLITEHVDMRAWARLWGRGISLFSPGMLIAALNAEAAACGGRTLRAGTRSTALSQHCLCGARVPKTLSDRVHACRSCGFTWDRDLTSAALAACVTFAEPTDPHTARVNPELADVMLRRLATQQEGQIRSTVTSHPPAPSWQGATDGSSKTPLPLPDDAAVHHRTPEQTRPPGRRRKRAKTTHEQHDPLRVNS